MNSWLGAHIFKKLKKIAKNIGVLYRVRYILESVELFTLYCSLILPYLQYCVAIWGCNYENNFKKIITLQKRAIRVVSKKRLREHSGPLFQYYRALCFHDIVKVSIAKIMFKVYINDAPASIQNMFNLVDEIHPYGTRQMGTFYHRYSGTTLKGFSITIKGPLIWDSIDKSIRSCYSLISFSNKCKKRPA